MALNLTVFDAVLKDDLEATVAKELNLEVKLLGKFEKKSDKFVGGNAVQPVHIRRNEGVGARGDGEALPAAGHQVHQRAAVPLRYNYGSIQLTGPTLKASQSSSGAFINALESEMDGMKDNLRSDINRQLNHTGIGTLGVVQDDLDGDAVIGFDVYSDAGEAGEPGNRFFRPGMLVDFINPATGLARNANPHTVSARGATIDNVTFTAVIAAGGAGDVAANDIAVKQGSYNREIQGLIEAVSAVGIYMGIDRGIVPEWQGQVLANAGVLRPLTLDLMQSAIDNGYELSGKYVDYIYSHPTIRQSYAALLTPDVRYGSVDSLKGGFGTLQYQGGDKPVTWDVDKDARYNTCWLLHTPSFSMLEQVPFQWADDDGRILRQRAGFDDFTAFMRYFGNLFCKNPNAQVRLEDIQHANAPVARPY